MSAWRIALAELHAAGGTADYRSFGDRVSRQELRKQGLATCTKDGRNLMETTWELTPLGREVAEGKVTFQRSRPGGRRWVATWLRSLPRINLAGGA